MIPGEIFTSFAELQGIVSVNDFRIPIKFQELFASFSGFLVKFLFCTDTPGSIEWLESDCISMIVSRFAIVA